MEKIVLALIPWKLPCAWESGSQALVLPGAEVLGHRGLQSFQGNVTESLLCHMDGV